MVVKATFSCGFSKKLISRVIPFLISCILMPIAIYLKGGLKVTEGLN